MVKDWIVSPPRAGIRARGYGCSSSGRAYATRVQYPVLLRSWVQPQNKVLSSSPGTAQREKKKTKRNSTKRTSQCNKIKLPIWRSHDYLCRKHWETWFFSSSPNKHILNYLISDFSKVTGYKIKIQKSILFLDRCFTI
jgi:hypothetical protein